MISGFSLNIPIILISTESTLLIKSDLNWNISISFSISDDRFIKIKLRYINLISITNKNRKKYYTLKWLRKSSLLWDIKFLIIKDAINL